jgi:hypothetical protein
MGAVLYILIDQDNREFDAVWNMFKSLPLLSVSCFDFQGRLNEKLDKE